MCQQVSFESHWAIFRYSHGSSGKHTSALVSCDGSSVQVTLNRAFTTDALMAKSESGSSEEKRPTGLKSACPASRYFDSPVLAAITMMAVWLRYAGTDSTTGGPDAMQTAEEWSHAGSLKVKFGNVRVTWRSVLQGG